jgi:hypothetical protein
MSYEVSPGNIFGRIGENLGKGLAESIPKEVERNRLASGLKELGNQKDLSPFERFSGLSSIPGITPQMIQSGSDILRQEARSKALIENSSREKPNPFQNKIPGTQKEPGKHPSITKGEILEKVQEGYIPPTIEERDAIAGQAYNENPAFFGNDPQKAIEWADSKIAQEEKIANAYETQHGKLTHIQDNVVERLKNQSERLNTKVPAELYSQIEDEAIQATKTKKDGGRGLTEQEAIKEFGDKLNDASRDFEKINEIGNWGITLRPASSTLRSMKQTQQQMEKLNQTDNYAKELISKTKVSPKFAYAVAEPISRVPNLNSFIKNLKPSEKNKKLTGAGQGIQSTKSQPDIKGTLYIAPELAKFVKENEKASPLAISYEIEKLGYDPETFLQYITDHAKELNIRQRQSEQASTPINVVNPWNDYWLQSFSGVE